jgi:hypothetical protein
MAAGDPEQSGDAVDRTYKEALSTALAVPMLLAGRIKQAI